MLCHLIFLVACFCVGTQELYIEGGPYLVNGKLWWMLWSPIPSQGIVYPVLNLMSVCKLIGIVRYNSRLIVYSNENACIYTFHEVVDYQPLRLPSYSYSYLFTIIPTDYSNNFFQSCIDRKKPDFWIIKIVELLLLFVWYFSTFTIFSLGQQLSPSHNFYCSNFIDSNQFTYRHQI